MLPTLLVIDVQRELVDALEPARRAALFDVLGGLLERARSAGAPVVYVRHDSSPYELISGTPGWEIAQEIAPRPGEPIVDKRHSDAFAETNLADVLRGAERVIISGMQSEFCVDATTREAERRGFGVTLVEDGHATFPSGEASERDIRERVNADARARTARLVPAAELYVRTAPQR